MTRLYPVEARIQAGDGNGIAIFSVGQELTPVVVVDNFLADARAFREQVCARSRFEAPDVGYPGQIAGMEVPDAAAFVGALRPILSNVFSLPSQSLGWSGMLSVTKTPRAKLSPLQCLPHIDDLRLFQVACVLYLFDGDLGGTGFFRQTNTGFERVTRQRYPRYRQSVEAEVRRRACLEPDYVGRDDPDYLCIGEVPPQFNRLVIYPSNLLHSGLVRGVSLMSTPVAGRLTANLFIGQSA